MFIVYTTLVFLHSHLAFSQQQWIDPHDMNIRDSNFIQKSSNNLYPSTQQCDCPAVPINFSMSHYKRLLNLILGSITVDRSDTFKGHLYINIPSESYDLLKSFASDPKNVEDSAMLRRVDQILSKVFVRPQLERLAEALTSWADHIYFTFYNRTTMILLSCIFLLFISYKLLRANLTIWSVVKYLIFLGWVTDFAFTWINLLQEAEINKMADSMMYESMPLHCNPNKMTFWQYCVYSMSSTSECRKYHQTVYKDHFWSIAPVTVLSHQFGVLIYTPASLIGEALGSFTSGLLGSLPWGVNIILLPVLLIFSAIIFCIVFSFLTQTSFGFNFLHVLQLEFGNEQRRIMGDVLSGQNLNAILNIAQRNMVEDVRQIDNSRTETSNCSNGNENNENLMIKAEASTSGAKNEKNTVMKKLDIDICLNGDNSKDTEGCDNDACLKCPSIKSPELSDPVLNENVSERITHDGSGDKM